VPQAEEIEHFFGSDYRTMIAIAPQEIGKSGFYENIFRLMTKHDLKVIDRTGRPCSSEECPNPAPEFNPEKMQVFYFEVDAYRTDQRLEGFVNSIQLPVEEIRIMGSYKKTGKDEDSPPSSIMQMAKKGLPPTSA
jgi:prephenate dehydratase